MKLSEEEFRNSTFLANIYSFIIQNLIQGVHCTPCTFNNDSQVSMYSRNHPSLMPCLWNKPFISDEPTRLELATSGVTVLSWNLQFQWVTWAMITKMRKNMTGCCTQIWGEARVKSDLIFNNYLVYYLLYVGLKGQ